MKRSDFGKLVLAGGVLGLASCAVPAKIRDNDINEIRPVIKPKRLKRGDTVGLIAPGSAFSKKAYKRTIENLKKLGLKYKNSENLFGQYGFVAGKDEDRIEDLHQMFEDKEVDAIWCVRGGYGTTRLLYDIDYELIKNNPKIIIGYSDITALLQAITKMTGLITFHGPVGSSELTDYNLENIKKVLFSGSENIGITQYTDEEQKNEYKSYILKKGKMRGELLGGNLSLLSALAGTKFDLDVKDRIVFIEDIGEKPYRIDRMLTQFIQSTNLEQASGILLGVFNDCDVVEGTEGSLTLKETLKDRLGNLGVPVYYGFSIGHIKNMCTVPVGIKAEFDMKNKELVLLENAVI